MWHLSSRVHKLNHFPNKDVECYVKRDDELGCGINGSKLRKYAALVPFFKKTGKKHLIIIAGPQSNNLLAALQIARELNLIVTAFLIKPWKLEIKGNFNLSQLFLSENEIIWVQRNQWLNVDNMAEEYLQLLKEPGFILSEGASVIEALPGAVSLAEDITRNEKELGFTFNHIFVDAGTGFSAAGLIKGFLENQHHALIHVLLLADDEETFRNKLNKWLGAIPTNFKCFYPETAKSFGSTNQVIKAEVRRMAREEGILADPIYSAKLFHESRLFIEEHKLQGKILIIHSGGALTMAGFNYI